MTERLAELQATGIQIVRGFFPRAELERMGQEIVEGVASGALTRNLQFVMGLDEAWFERLYKNEALLDLLSEALGEDICYVSLRALMKDGHFDGPIEAHQDWPYFGGDTRKLNVFVPLTPVNLENGGLTFYEQSHLYGPLERGAIDVERYADLKQTCPELEVGDILLGDILTWHHSTPALAPRNRIMIQLIFQPASDASSKIIVRGKLPHDKVCGQRFEPMREPRSQNYEWARTYLAAGDLDLAERFTRGLLADDPLDLRAALLIHDVYKARGLPTEWCVNMAVKCFEHLRQELASRTDQAAQPAPSSPDQGAQARIEALEAEIAALKAAPPRKGLSRLFG